MANTLRVLTFTLFLGTLGSCGPSSSDFDTLEAKVEGLQSQNISDGEGLEKSTAENEVLPESLCLAETITNITKRPFGKEIPPTNGKCPSGLRPVGDGLKESICIYSTPIVAAKKVCQFLLRSQFSAEKWKTAEDQIKPVLFSSVSLEDWRASQFGPDASYGCYVPCSLTSSPQ